MIHVLSCSAAIHARPGCPDGRIGLGWNWPGYLGSALNRASPVVIAAQQVTSLGGRDGKPPARPTESARADKDRRAVISGAHTLFPLASGAEATISPEEASAVLARTDALLASAFATEALAAPEGALAIVASAYSLPGTAWMAGPVRSAEHGAAFVAGTLPGSTRMAQARVANERAGTGLADAFLFQVACRAEGSSALKGPATGFVSAGALRAATGGTHKRLSLELAPALSVAADALSVAACGAVPIGTREDALASFGCASPLLTLAEPAVPVGALKGALTSIRRANALLHATGHSNSLRRASDS
jgi:hypothetical protein